MISQGAAVQLPRLRQNLRLLQASPDEDGEPRWQIFDPSSNKFYYLSRTAFYLFREWSQAGEAQALLAKLAARDIQVEQDEFEFFVKFLQLNHLLEATTDADIERFVAEENKTKKHILLWLLHNYLFIKIPLVRPDLFLTRAYPHMKWLFTLPLHWFALFFGVLGLAMVLRQWETFVHTMQNFFSVTAIAYYVLALIFVKTAHELGHALVAKRYGCRVSSMGVALLLMTPILYTDTTDAWRLRSRFQRLSIVTAGVRVEIYIACGATFLWAIVPEGDVRSVLFFIGTTSWISSLFINISPFMRFDGYYALSDFLGMENLQPRSFLVGKWFLRECLFRFGFAPPEPLNRKKCALMVLYAWSTWVYRFFLFVGIAALVYYFTFKVLGIVLFLVEILWFVLLPIAKEVGVWIGMREKMTLNRTSLLSLVILMGAIWALLFPWQTHIAVPAVVTSEQYQTVYPNAAAQVVSWRVSPNQSVTANQLLVLLESADLEKKIHSTQVQLDKWQALWQRSSSGGSTKDSALRFQTEMAREQSRLMSLLEQREQLAIRAPFDGFIGELQPLMVGDYVSNKAPLVTVYSHQKPIVKAYISGANVAQLVKDGEAQFIGNDGEKLGSLLMIKKVVPTAIKHLDYLGLSSTYGGEISTQTQGNYQVPVEATYEVQLFWPDDREITRQQAGVVRLPIEPSSVVVDAARRLYGVFIRESGF